MIFWALCSKTSFANFYEIEVRFNGKNVKKAQIWKVKREFHSQETSVEKFEYQADQKLFLKINSDEKLHVKDDQGNVGFKDSFDSRTKKIIVNLLHTEKFQRQILDQNKKPVTDCSIKLNYACIPKNKENDSEIDDTINYQDYSVIADKKYKTDGNGFFTIEDMPVGSEIGISFVTKDKVNGEIFFDLDKNKPGIIPETTTLEFKVNGKFKEFDHKKYEVYINLDVKSCKNRYNTAYNNAQIIDWSENNKAKNIFPNSYFLSVGNIGLSTTILSYQQNTFEVKNNQTNQITLDSEDGKIVKGKVIDKQTKKPIEKIFLTSGRTYCSSDQNGDFKLNISANGEEKISFFNDFNRFYLIPTDMKTESAMEKINASEFTQIIELEKGKTLKISLTDKKNKDVKPPYFFRHITKSGYYKTIEYDLDTDGKIIFHGMRENQSSIFLASVGNSVNIPVFIKQHDYTKIHTITLSEENAVTIRGRFFDEKSVPYQNMDINLIIYYVDVENNMNYINHESTCKTNEKGEFEFKGLWPNLKYYVTFEKFNTNKINSDTNSFKKRSFEPGQVHFQELVLTRSKMNELNGQIIYSDGKPAEEVSVAMVDLAGNCFQKKTSANGMFQFKEIQGEKVVITAGKNGYKDTFKLIDNFKDTHVVVLRKIEEKPEQYKTVSKEFLDEQKKMLIDFCQLAVRKDRDHSLGGTFVRAVARHDTELANKLLIDLSLERKTEYRLYSEKFRTKSTTLQFAKDSPQEFFRLAKFHLKDWDHQILEMIPHIDKKYKSEIIDILREITENLRINQNKIIDITYANRLAHIARIYKEFDQVNDSNNLFEEAIKFADQSHENSKDFIYGAITEHYGMVDFDKAISLARKCKNTHYALSASRNIFKTLIKNDTDKGLEKIEKFSMNKEITYDQFFYFNIIDAIPENRFETALKLVESNHVYDQKQKVQLLSNIAFKIRKLNQKKSIEIIDYCFKIMDDASSNASFEEDALLGCKPIAAAQVAFVAHQAGYPDMYTLTAKVFKYRDHKNSSKTNNLLFTAKLALAISLYDPRTAGFLLDSISAQEYDTEIFKSKEFVLAEALCRPAVAYQKFNTLLKNCTTEIMQKSYYPSYVESVSKYLANLDKFDHSRLLVFEEIVNP